MGSPLSPVLANLFMECFESEMLVTLPFRPPFWARYIDDIIIFWPDSEDFQDFFTRVNSLVPTINFTTEWEQNGSLYAKCGRWHPEVDWLCIPIPTKICEVIPIPDNF